MHLTGMKLFHPFLVFIIDDIISNAVQKPLNWEDLIKGIRNLSERHLILKFNIPALGQMYGAIVR
ncbi:MAG: hypothetical protein V1862_13935 [Methanobacteriota archaeon]